MLRHRGLSPRVRGNPLTRPPGTGAARSIPACAGEPGLPIPGRLRQQVYPRVCGGTPFFSATGTSSTGLSPRVRGNPAILGAARNDSRSIPACAGEPRFRLLLVPLAKVYPRVCGGTPLTRQPHPPPADLSPRVRGNPLQQIAGPGALEVYPRVCGGTTQTGRAANRPAGLSPRVRGNLSGFAVLTNQTGSIPACAGEPVSPIAANPGAPVYPRVCGGTPTAFPPPCTRRGLSPRVRGNPCGKQPPGRTPRSIPACAGEPRWLWCAASCWAVYPRVCGGTTPAATPPPAARGLSPRVRGNRLGNANRKSAARSIPACAGEPLPPPAPTGGPTVYPRVCGGTSAAVPGCLPSPGLSPRVRGNRTTPISEYSYQRSIPACAGEPSGGITGFSDGEVYPRVCGGTDRPPY